MLLVQQLKQFIKRFYFFFVSSLLRQLSPFLCMVSNLFSKFLGFKSSSLKPVRLSGEMGATPLTDFIAPTGQ